MSEQKDEALRLYEKFYQFDWDAKKGWMPNDKESKKVAKMVVDEIAQVSQLLGESRLVDFYRGVIKEIDKL
jgi:gamma-glutamyltranspeptidase